MAGHGGGAWKVAYADFVTAMMAFFLVMWLTSQSDETKKAIGGYFNDPWGSSSENTTTDHKLPTGLGGDTPFADSATGILPQRWPQANVDNATDRRPGAASVWQQKHKVHVVADDRNLPSLTVTFNEGSAELSPDAQNRLNDLMPALIGKQNRIELRSHSTRRPLPKDAPYRDHWQLCFERSQQVMKFLLGKGVEGDRIRLSQSASYEPLTTRLEASWQDENNCVEVFVLNNVVDKITETTRSNSGAE